MACWQDVPARASSPSAEPFFSFQRRFFEQAITLPGPEVDLLAEACRKHRMTVAIGVTERPVHDGTLYNTLLYLGPDGSLLGRHRKLVPTFAERMIGGSGDGSTLRTLQTEQGINRLTCRLACLNGDRKIYFCVPPFTSRQNGSALGQFESQQE